MPRKGLVNFTIYWLASLAALVGIYLNIQKNRLCFWIWACTNAVWAVADFRHGIYPQAALQAVYFALSLYGIWKWRSGRMAE